MKNEIYSAQRLNYDWSWLLLKLDNEAEKYYTSTEQLQVHCIIFITASSRINGHFSYFV